MQLGAARLFQAGVFAPAAFQIGVERPGLFQPGLFQPGLFQLTPEPRVPVREAAFEAIAARLRARLGLPVERNRRSPFDGGEGMPRFVLRDGGHQATAELAQGEWQYAVEATLEGYTTAASDAALGAAINRLHARAIAALAGAEIPVGSAGQSIWILEESLEVDFAPATDAESPVAAFFCGLRFELSWPLDAGPFTT